MNFDDLYKKYKRLVMFIVYRSIRKFPILQEESQDLIQDCWLYIFNHVMARHNEKAGSLSTLIFTSLSRYLHNEAIKRYNSLHVAYNFDIPRESNFMQQVEVNNFLEKTLGKEDSLIMNLYLGIDQPAMKQTEIAAHIGTLFSKKTHKNINGFSAMLINQRIKKSKSKLLKYFS